MTTELEERSRKLIETLEELGVTGVSDTIEKDQRGNIAVRLGLGEKTVLNYLSDWRKAGYMGSTKTTGRGRPVEFKLLYDLDVIKKKASATLDIAKMGKEKRLDFQKEAEFFLDSFGKKVSYGRDWTEKKVREALKTDIPLPQVSFFQKETEVEPSLVQEKERDVFPISPISEVKGLNPEKKPVLSGLENTLRDTWKTGTTEDFKKLAQQKGDLNELETEAFVENLFEEGKIAYDPEGWLVWVR